MCKVPYCKAIGSLMYTSVATCSDIMFAVSTLSQFLKNLGEVHWEAVKWVFCYLSGMHDIVLMYRGVKHDVTIRNHAYQKLFPFVVTRPSSLLPLPSTHIYDRHVVKLHNFRSSINDRYVVKLHILELVRYDVKLHIPGLGPDAWYSAKLQPQTSRPSRSPQQYQ